MKLLEQRIIQDGKIINNNVIKVDSFLNHQLDTAFLNELGQQIYDYFKERKINKILTIEASGIALATLTALHFEDIPVVFCKKQKTSNIGKDIFESKVKSYTTNKEYIITVSKRFLSPEDNILIIDDFLAEGNALLGMIDVCNQAKANIEGISVAIEKGFQDGGKIIRQKGFDLLSLAIVERVENGNIYFKNH
ncbi:MAG: xanthine phosphoribosyltransferase [Tissierellia bacterium]|nr:xanthine phosphoribosyltransferase [Tissierellia bacterium]